MSKYHINMNCARWFRIRADVLFRAHWSCERCGQQHGRLEVHHIRPLWKGGAPYDMDNLELLCQNCHIEHHGGRRTPWRRLMRMTDAEVYARSKKAKEKANA